MKLTKANLTDVIEGIMFSEFRAISPDDESKKDGVKKTIHLKIKYDGLTLNDVIAKAFKSDCVSWQNGSGGRKNFDNLVDKQVVEISAKAPGAAVQIDPITAVIEAAKAAKLSVEEYLKKEIAARKLTE